MRVDSTYRERSVPLRKADVEPKLRAIRALFDLKRDRGIPVAFTSLLSRGDHACDAWQWAPGQRIIDITTKAACAVTLKIDWTRYRVEVDKATSCYTYRGHIYIYAFVHNVENKRRSRILRFSSSRKWNMQVESKNIPLTRLSYSYPGVDSENNIKLRSHVSYVFNQWCVSILFVEGWFFD